jgi:hypothetical protein
VGPWPTRQLVHSGASGELLHVMATMKHGVGGK